ncbi:hypothetical protein, partial [Dyella choica]|uniref:hypothetical protein n=1 Tax=Dyella choica TaxID=1927959 RepID=UPI001E32A134
RLEDCAMRAPLSIIEQRQAIDLATSFVGKPQGQSALLTLRLCTLAPVFRSPVGSRGACQATPSTRSEKKTIIFLGSLSNSGLAVRRYSEIRAVSPADDLMGERKCRNI